MCVKGENTAARPHTQIWNLDFGLGHLALAQVTSAPSWSTHAPVPVYKATEVLHSLHNEENDICESLECELDADLLCFSLALIGVLASRQEVPIKRVWTEHGQFLPRSPARGALGQVVHDLLQFWVGFENHVPVVTKPGSGDTSQGRFQFRTTRIPQKPSGNVAVRGGK